MLQLDRFIFPLFSAAPTPEMVRIQRFLGCGFWLDEYGCFATCKHVLDQVGDNQALVIGHPAGSRSNYFFPVRSTVSHAHFDVAEGREPSSAVGRVLRSNDRDFGLGLDVQAFGYTDSGKEGGAELSSQLADESFGLPSPTLIEVPFGSPSGFSGTPLLVDSRVVGILYSNLDSKLEAYEEV